MNLVDEFLNYLEYERNYSKHTVIEMILKYLFYIVMITIKIYVMWIIMILEIILVIYINYNIKPNQWQE